MLNYYHYLLETYDNLKKTGNLYEEAIEKLESEAQILDNELLQYKFTDNELESVDPLEFKNMEEKAKF